MWPRVAGDHIWRNVLGTVHGSVPKGQNGRMFMSQTNYRNQYHQFIVASTHVLPVTYALTKFESVFLSTRNS